MSVNIIGSTIKLTRGDTLKLKLSITDSLGQEYLPTEDDYIRFACKKRYNDDEPIILKDIPTDTLELVLESQDTASLPQPSDYVYDIQITLSDGTVDTIIPNGRLFITEEVD